MFSLCEHHMAAVLRQGAGRLHPEMAGVIGLSKIPRLNRIVFPRRLQIQERLNHARLLKRIQKVIEPQGVGVVIEARQTSLYDDARRREAALCGPLTSSMLGLLPQ